jgi:SAM-dependent methyltransferase
MLRRVASALSLPLRRYFNPRFQSVQARLDSTLDELAVARKEIVRAENELIARNDRLTDMLSHDIEISTETTKVMGTYLADILAATEAIGLGVPEHVRRLAEGNVEDLDEAIAAVLSYAETPMGFAAQRGLFFNPPVWLGYEPSDVRVLGVNERIAEVPYVFGMLGQLPAGSRVLDVGAAESLVSLSLASLGHRVTAVDPRPYPLPHPQLQVVVGAIQDLEVDELFDAVVCLSTVEHIGLPAYGGTPADADADRVAMQRMRELTRPGGLLVLTVPYGRAAVDEFQRVYDDAGLAQLVGGWEVFDRRLLRRLDAITWTTADRVFDDTEMTAMIAARRID